MPRHTHARRGAAAVEFALTLPIYLVMIGAVFEYGWYLNQLTSVVHSAREGVRYAVTIDQDDNPETEAINQTTAVLEGLGIDCSGGSSCTITATTSGAGSVDTLTISVLVDYTPIAAGLIPAPSTLQTNYTMALEDQSDES